MRDISFVKGEYYHIFNRGVDKRNIFSDKDDVMRFLKSLKEFNRIETGNDIFLINKRKVGYRVANKIKDKEKLVNIICYCVNPNHFHFIIEEVFEGGISKFMKRLCGGYSNYYNKKYERSGSLFQGKFKSIHVESNEQLIYLSFYVNLNNKVHKKFDNIKDSFIDEIMERSSWSEYINKKVNGVCNKYIVINQFKNLNDYKKSALEVLRTIKEKRYEN